MDKNKPVLITVVGPTATGKTSFAARLARETDGEIISADSRQVYRRMDIGTGKDKDDYLVKGSRIPSHLIDIAEPGYKYSVYEFRRDFLKAYHDIVSRGRQPVLCGGTGMYIEAAVKGYMLIEVPHDTELRKELETKSMKELESMLARYRHPHNVSDTSSRKRLVRAVEIAVYQSKYGKLRENDDHPRFENLLIGLTADRDERRRRITERLKKRIASGLIGEVRSLLDEGVKAEDLKYYGLEYRYVTMYILGELDYGEMFAKLNTEIHRFAKRQMTWFRRMERQGFNIHWLDAGMPEDLKTEKAMQLYKKAGRAGNSRFRKR